MKIKSKTMPSLKSDADAEQFVATADLSQYNLSGFKPKRFEYEPKVAALNMRIPQNLLDALKFKAKGISLLMGTSLTPISEVVAG